MKLYFYEILLGPQASQLLLHKFAISGINMWEKVQGRMITACDNFSKIANVVGRNGRQSTINIVPIKEFCKFQERGERLLANFLTKLTKDSTILQMLGSCVIALLGEHQIHAPGI